ncbi:hypothetical protein LJR219_001625 [Phenylobacterium sp. LjRoot219]|uniref:hypothetical protein n=1 Tax=Phenylobacterium sp. LjRoot219 TaxID=3342283 RepID=UPI003ED10E91
MTACADYAQLFETEIRPRRRLDRRVRKLAAYALWAGLFLIRPRLALQILRDRPDCGAGLSR